MRLIQLLVLATTMASGASAEATPGACAEATAALREALAARTALSDVFANVLEEMNAAVDELPGGQRDAGLTMAAAAFGPNLARHQVESDRLGAAHDALGDAVQALCEASE